MTVSVVIPFYNLAAYVRPALESVACAVRMVSGADLSVEVLCVDDGSTDATGETLEAFVKSACAVADGLVWRIVHKANGGEGSARNAGLDLATGDWLTFLDGDDVWLPNLLVAFLDGIGRFPQTDILGFRFVPFEDGASTPAPTEEARSYRRYGLRADVPSAVLLDLGVFPTFFRREKFRKVRFSALPLGADRLYVAQCLAVADEAVLSPLGVLGYRVRAGSMARAEWNDRKIVSLVDYAAGALAALTGSGKRLGRKGAAYLTDLLLSVTPKYLRRATGDVTNARRHWLGTLSRLDVRPLPVGARLKLRLVRGLGRWI